MNKKVKHYTDVEVQCPFYIEESQNVIYCEGVTSGSRLHNAFSKGVKSYKQSFCCTDWKNCRISRMLWEKYE